MKFGTSGLRGLVDDMTDAVCARYTRAFLDHLSRGGLSAPRLMLVGRDLRPSSPRIAAAVRTAAVAAGFEAGDCGVLPTPALALEAAALGASAIMVTGSHIPFDRNGLKFYRPGGEIDKQDEEGILAALSRLTGPVPGGRDHARRDAGARYATRIVEAFAPDALSGLRVGVWEHSAAGRDLTATILEALGAQVIRLGRTDDFVPIDTEALSPRDAAQARTWVGEHRLDAVISTDGDGDRPLVFDERGDFVRGDLLGMFAARFLGADAVATPVSSSTALERSGWFSRVARTRIGSPHVIAALGALAQEGAATPVGFEANGGFILAADAAIADGGRLCALPTRDALTPIVCVLRMAVGRGVTLSALMAAAPARGGASGRIAEAPVALTAALIAALAASREQREQFLADVGVGPALSLDLTDGLRMMLAGDETLHLRPSGNAPELRAYAEAVRADRAEALVADALAVAGARLAAMRRSGVVAP